MGKDAGMRDGISRAIECVVLIWLWFAHRHAVNDGGIVHLVASRDARHQAHVALLALHAVGRGR